VSTFTGFAAGGGESGNRIDYIFVTTGVNILKYGVLTDYREQRFASDHLPVMVKMEVE
jgi:endonuclease/exonuclease/phosphatase family metal-dependent hydrolase